MEWYIIFVAQVDPPHELLKSSEPLPPDVGAAFASIVPYTPRTDIVYLDSPSFHHQTFQVPKMEVLTHKLYVRLMQEKKPPPKIAL